MGAQHGFGVTAVDPVMTSDGEVYSSSIICAHLREGRPAKAAELLGRPWEIEGRVEQRDRRRRTLGFPTANIGLGESPRPACGAYAVSAGFDPGVEAGGATRWPRGCALLSRRTPA